MTFLLLAACAKPMPVARGVDAAVPAGPDCAPGTPCAYEGGLLPLASGFAAKEACSCLFVAGRTEAECRAWVKVDPAVASLRIDAAHHRVVAHALGLAPAVATWEGPRHGCVLEVR